tara:strand:- start:3184 stop:3894 length:711 start_codon:yes stop_codon:yes gene_type:complete
MTLNEIAHNILNLYRGGRPSQSEHISIDQVKFNIKHYRAMLLRRDYSRNGMITRHSEQDLGCIELEEVNASKCCDLPVTCRVARSIKKIPRTVRFNFSEALTHIGDVSGIHTIPFIDKIMVQYLPYDKYTATKHKAYMIEDHLYVYNAEGLKYINVRGVFEDPADLKDFDCEDGVCYDDNSKFPMPADMIQAVTLGMASGELQLLSGTFSDSTTDTLQDPITISKAPSPGPAPEGG